MSLRAINLNEIGHGEAAARAATSNKNIPDWLSAGRRRHTYTTVDIHTCHGRRLMMRLPQVVSRPASGAAINYAKHARIAKTAPGPARNQRRQG